MYPNLYFLFEDLFGFSHPFLKLINSFGFFVALAFIAGSYTLSRELKRKEEEGSTGNLLSLPRPHFGFNSNSGNFQISKH